MSNNFKIAETNRFRKKIKKLEFGEIYHKIYNYVYPQLRQNPFFGLNIKKLKGEFSGIYRYRVSDYRLFYTVEKDKVLVIMIDIAKRGNGY